MVVVAVGSQTPCLLSLSPAVGCVPHLSPTTRLWAASLGRTGQEVPPGCAVGAAVVVVAGSLVGRCSWEERAEAGPGVRFALGKGEPGGMLGGGKEDDVGFGGSCNISNTKMQ